MNIYTNIYVQILMLMKIRTGSDRRLCKLFLLPSISVLKLAGLSRSSEVSCFSHPPTIPWEFHTHTVGPIPHYLRARPQRTTRTRGPHHARHPASKATSPGSYPTSSHPLHTARPAWHARIMHAPGKHGHVPLLVPYQWPSPRTGPHPLPTARPARHAHLHDAQPRFHSTHRIRRRNTAPPQVASDASTLHGAQGPKSPWPGSGPHR
jgi:hypothetical protein